MNFDTAYITMLIIMFVPILVISGILAFTMMAFILRKSNNLGTKNAVTNSIDGGFIIYEKGIVARNSTPSRKINNPVILKNMFSEDDESYLSDKNLNTLESEIDSADLSGISWHT